MRKAMWLCTIAVFGLGAAQLGGCYYMQAVGGQLELLRKREPIAEVLEDPGLEDGTRRKLELVLEARRFAVDELSLPDNDSYRSYADLERDFVVWNVFAAPEFSLDPKTWCFPIVGCVAYRGYFAEAAALRHAAKLAERGYDVHVGGVPAYSTLGRFDDPLLNTMMRRPEIDLVATLFHELAHQRLFVKGDTGFNESFATLVAEAGLERWLAGHGGDADIDAYRRRGELHRALRRLADEARDDLARLYAQALDDETRRRRKQARFERLAADAEDAAEASGFEDAGWLRPPLNNARLASVSLYRGTLPAFRQLFADCNERFDCFYAQAERLAGVPRERRTKMLEALASGAPADAMKRRSDY